MPNEMRISANRAYFLKKKYQPIRSLTSSIRKIVKIQGKFVPETGKRRERENKYSASTLKTMFPYKQSPKTKSNSLFILEQDDRSKRNFSVKPDDQVPLSILTA